MPEKLDKEKVLRLLAEANTLWFKSRLGTFDFQEHLKFTAEYIVRNYNKEGKK